MLSQLFIENIAVVEKTSIDFHHGLNVLTGETGAGKSIIIDAIHAVLGQRTSRDLIRTGTEKATVSAVFTGLSRHTVAEMESFGFDPEEDGTLVLQREITSAGKSVCRVNGRPAPVSVLRELGARLIQIHGQNENLDLLVPGVSLGYLDRLGNLQELVGRYRDAYNAMRKVQQALDSLQMDEAEKARRLDLLRFQIGELEQADIQLGEIEELKTKKQLYMNSERVARALLQAKAAMDGDEETAGSLQLLRLASDAAEEAGRYLPQAKELATRIQSAQYELEDCLEELRELDEQVEYDPADVEDVELRLDLLHRLSRKYGPDEEEILRYLNQAKKELESIEFSEERSRALEKEYRSLRKNAQALAEQLSSSRLAAARSFEKAVKIQLQFLDMPGVRLQVDLEKGTLGESGQDEARFLISTNPGEPPKPIAKIASGGELSRIMLAIKTVLAAHDEVDTLIFDEVDTGVSGSAAQKVGLKLREVAESRQVLCVTHSAQIAALANVHLFIQKAVRCGRTYTTVSPLSFEGRKMELARIIGGVQITELTIKNAGEMLRLAGFQSDGLDSGHRDGYNDGNGEEKKK